MKKFLWTVLFLLVVSIAVNVFTLSHLGRIRRDKESLSNRYWNEGETYKKTVDELTQTLEAEKGNAQRQREADAVKADEALAVLRGQIAELQTPVEKRAVSYVYAKDGTIYFVDTKGGKTMIAGAVVDIKDLTGSASYSDPILSPGDGFVAANMSGWENGQVVIFSVSTKEKFPVVLTEKQESVWYAKQLSWLPDGRLQAVTEPAEISGWPGGTFTSVSPEKPWEMK